MKTGKGQFRGQKETGSLPLPMKLPRKAKETETRQNKTSSDCGVSMATGWTVNPRLHTLQHQANTVYFFFLLSLSLLLFSFSASLCVSLSMSLSLPPSPPPPSELSFESEMFEMHCIQHHNKPNQLLQLVFVFLFRISFFLAPPRPPPTPALAPRLKIFFFLMCPKYVGIYKR